MPAVNSRSPGLREAWRTLADGSVTPSALANLIIREPNGVDTRGSNSCKKKRAHGFSALEKFSQLAFNLRLVPFLIREALPRRAAALGRCALTEDLVSGTQPHVANKPPLSAIEKERLFVAAREVLGRAYAPYSKFHVGAAVLAASGAVYCGCNVENASYGLTLCAERSAISAGVAAEGASFRIRAIAVLNQNDAPCSPCGACRQVIFEFGRDADVIFQGTHALEHSTARALLPAGFTL